MSAPQEEKVEQDSNLKAADESYGSNQIGGESRDDNETLSANKGASEHIRQPSQSQDSSRTRSTNASAAMVIDWTQSSGSFDWADEDEDDDEIYKGLEERRRASMAQQVAEAEVQDDMVDAVEADADKEANNSGNLATIEEEEEEEIEIGERKKERRGEEYHKDDTEEDGEVGDEKLHQYLKPICTLCDYMYEGEEEWRDQAVRHQTSPRCPKRNLPSGCRNLACQKVHHYTWNCPEERYKRPASILVNGTTSPLRYSWHAGDTCNMDTEASHGLSDDDEPTDEKSDESSEFEDYPEAFPSPDAEGKEDIVVSPLSDAERSTDSENDDEVAISPNEEAPIANTSNDSANITEAQTSDSLDMPTLRALLHDQTQRARFYETEFNRCFDWFNDDMDGATSLEQAQAHYNGLAQLKSERQRFFSYLRHSYKTTKSHIEDYRDVSELISRLIESSVTENNWREGLKAKEEAQRRLKETTARLQQEQALTGELRSEVQILEAEAKDLSREYMASREEADTASKELRDMKQQTSNDQTPGAKAATHALSPPGSCDEAVTEHLATIEMLTKQVAALKDDIADSARRRDRAREEADTSQKMERRIDQGEIRVLESKIEDLRAEADVRHARLARRHRKTRKPSETGVQAITYVKVDRTREYYQSRVQFWMTCTTEEAEQSIATIVGRVRLSLDKLARRIQGSCDLSKSAARGDKRHMLVCKRCEEQKAYVQVIDQVVRDQARATRRRDHWIGMERTQEYALKQHRECLEYLGLTRLYTMIEEAAQHDDAPPDPRKLGSPHNSTRANLRTRDYRARQSGRLEDAPTDEEWDAALLKERQDEKKFLADKKAGARESLHFSRPDASGVADSDADRQIAEMMASEGSDEPDQATLLAMFNKPGLKGAGDASDGVGHEKD